MIVDLFGTDCFNVGLEFGMKPYLFFASTGMCLSLFLNLPILDVQVSCEYRDMKEVIELPGCTPIHGKYLLDPVQDRDSEAYKWVLYHAERYKLAEGIMVNTFSELEEGVLKFLTNNEPGKPLVYLVGPLVRPGSNDGTMDRSECLKWLDDQPHGSVLFVSFGGGGTLSHNQIIELAHGLEMSEQRFLWVLRKPNDVSQNDAYFSIVGDKNSPLDFLPRGVLDRIKKRGLVILNWAPQVKILNHCATGGFLTHCGWNSILESMVYRVPLIAWPLYAEQKMNAIMLSEGLVGQGDIASVINSLMKGEKGKKMRNRMEDLKDAAASALREDGSSTKALLEERLYSRKEEN